MDNEYGLKEVHKRLLVLLDMLDYLCRKNNINYSLHGGTLLGAERNGKLIPWDDDMDISMTRDNYENFKKICSSLKNGFYINEIDTWVPRFVYEKDEDNAFIDIFIWDYISENIIAQKTKIYVLRFLQGTLKKNVEYKNYNIVNRILLKFTYVIGKPFSREKKIKLFKYIEANILTGKRKFIHRSNDAYLGVSYIFDNGYMLNYIDIELEGKLYMVTARYQEFLIRNYGKDYLIPPSLQERKPLHEKQRENFLSKRNANES